MTVELTDSMKNLVALQRASLAAYEAVRGEPYSAEVWQPWYDAAQRFQDAVTAHGGDRVAVEMLAKAEAKKPEANQSKPVQEADAAPGS